MFAERFDALMNIAEYYGTFQQPAGTGDQHESLPHRTAALRCTASAEAPRVSARDVRLSGSAPTLRE